jgi:hypothetical protein
MIILSAWRMLVARKTWMAGSSPAVTTSLEKRYSKNPWQQPRAHRLLGAHSEETPHGRAAEASSSAAA